MKDAGVVVLIDFCLRLGVTLLLRIAALACLSAPATAKSDRLVQPEIQREQRGTLPIIARDQRCSWRGVGIERSELRNHDARGVRIDSQGGPVGEQRVAVEV